MAAKGGQRHHHGTASEDKEALEHFDEIRKEVFHELTNEEDLARAEDQRLMKEAEEVEKQNRKFLKVLFDWVGNLLTPAAALKNSFKKYLTVIIFSGQISFQREAEQVGSTEQ